MHNITCFDEFGNVLYSFTQWDLNQKIYIEDLDFASIPSFHFQNKNTIRALVVTGQRESNGMISFLVPNHLLIQPYPVSIYIYVSEGASSKVVDSIQIPVRERQQPNDFIFQDNMEFIALEEVRRKLAALKADLEQLSLHASNIPYDNTESGLEEDTVQEAIDEIANGRIYIDDEEDDGFGDDSGNTGGDSGDDNDDGDNGEDDGDDTNGSGDSGDNGEDDIAYQTIQVSNAKDIIQTAINNMTMNNSTTKNDIQSVITTALLNAGITDVIASVNSFNKTNATTSVTGVIISNILVTCGHVSDSFAMSKTIEKLPIDDAGKVANAKSIIQTVINNMTVNNDTTQLDIQSTINTALSDASIIDVTAMVQNISMTKATYTSIGSITGLIAITCGTSSDSVTINKTIAKLPLSSEEKVANAKTVIQTAMNNMTVTNDTTQSTIQTIVNNALKSASLTDVTATVGSINKTNATTSTKGTLTGVVSIICGDFTDSVSISKEIAQLPLSDTNKVAGAKSIIQTALDNMTVDNNTTQSDIQSVVDTALSSASITDVTATVGGVIKTNATYDDAGNISGNIYIACGTAYDNLSINKTIEQLQLPDPDKVANAKTVIQTAINSMTATNEMTQADIQSIVDTALNNANIKDVTATVKNISKTNATINAVGSLSGTVSITKGSASDSVSISKTIAKLPKTNADKVAEAKIVVQEAINDMTVSNATNTSNIQKIVNDALADAGITDVSATASNVVNTNATTSTAGTLTGLVNIQCGTASDNISINKTIAIILEADMEEVSKAKNLINFYYLNEVDSFDTSTTEEHCLETTEYGLDLYSRIYSEIYTPVSDNVSLNICDFVYNTTNNKITYDVIITCGSCADVYSVSKSAYNELDSWNAGVGSGSDTMADMALTLISSYFSAHATFTNTTSALTLERMCVKASYNLGVIINISNYAITQCTSASALGSVSGTVTATFNGETKAMTFSEKIRHIPNNGEVVYLYNQGSISSWCGGFVNRISYYADKYVTNTTASSYLAIDISDYDGDLSYINSDWRFKNRLYLGDFSKMCVQYDFDCDDITNSGDIEFRLYETSSSFSSYSVITTKLSAEVTDAIETYNAFGYASPSNTKAYQGFGLQVNKPIRACTLRIKKIWLEP